MVLKADAAGVERRARDSVRLAVAMIVTRDDRWNVKAEESLQTQNLMPAWRFVSLERGLYICAQHVKVGAVHVHKQTANTA